MQEPLNAKECMTAELEKYIKQYGADYELSRQACECLIDVCNVIDLLHEEDGVDRFGFEVSPAYKDAMVYADMPDVVFQGGRTHPFFKAISGASRVRFSQAASDTLRIMINVDNLWLQK